MVGEICVIDMFFGIECGVGGNFRGIGLGVREWGWVVNCFFYSFRLMLLF